MDLDAIADFISRVGFPIAVTAYLLIVHDFRLKQIVDELKKQNHKS